MLYDEDSLWSAETSKLIHDYITEARKGPRTTHLLPAFASIAMGKTGRPDVSRVRLNEALVDDVPAQAFYPHLRQTTGTFHEHLNASIPYFLEEQCRLGSAISSYCAHTSLHHEPLRLWSLGSAEGPMARAIASASNKSVRVLCSSENVENFQILRENPEPDVQYKVGPFYDIAREVVTGHSSSATFAQQFDIIFEHTSFQMHHPDRLAPILLLRRALKPDGIVLLYEKVLDSDMSAYADKENEKDLQFKSRYFSAAEVRAKKVNILGDMEKCQVVIEALFRASCAVFRHVFVIWRSGNFVGLAASNSHVNIRRLVSLMPAPFIENKDYLVGLPQPGCLGIQPLSFREKSS